MATSDPQRSITDKEAEAEEAAAQAAQKRVDDARKEREDAAKLANAGKADDAPLPGEAKVEPEASTPEEPLGDRREREAAPKPARKAPAKASANGRRKP